MAGRSSLNEDSVDSEQIFDACITTAKIADDAVTQDKIANDSVGTDQLADGVLSANGRTRVAYAQVNAHATAKTPIGTIPAGAMIRDVIIQFSTAMNGNGTIDLGRVSNLGSILPNASIARSLNDVSGDVLSTRGTDLWASGAQNDIADYEVTTWAGPKRYYCKANTVIEADVTKDTTTTGVAEVYIIYDMVVMAD